MAEVEVVTTPLLSFPPAERLVGHTWSVNAVAYSPDGSRIVSGSSDETLKIWDANSGKLLSSLEAHTEGVSGVAFSPSGHLIYSASYDRTIKVWPSNIDNSIGKAIVIAASGAHRSNTLFPYTDELAKKMYHTLKQRGFTDKNIIYLNPDFFQDIDG
ncbi:WD40 repeat domain-containing protein, partial [Candidatus Marithrix sp. Canyon 246]|uniref:WD40 repeat domain-containing protein n=2 Tax=Candidatus Marithrix sp. Canyon 246 TaxID=1827136 RepID=UPI00209AF4BE